MSEYVDETPYSGTLLVPAGLPAAVRIPIPGTAGLAIEFRPREFKGRSTSTLFLQDVTGKRHLRLDFGPNKRRPSPSGAPMIDYHWNQSGTKEHFKIENHASIGPGGRIAYGAAKHYRYLGRTFVVVGMAGDVYSIARAGKPLRRATAVGGAWAAAAAGCRAGGALGAGIGIRLHPIFGTLGGGLIGCALGGYAGYEAGEAGGGALYDWAEDTVFTPLVPEVEPPKAGGSELPRFGGLP